MENLLPNITIQPLQSNLFNGFDIDVLRLDLLHPIVSGNKYFKLKYYLKDAINDNKKTIATFGGAFSNHIVATAFACKEMGLKSIGIIRGEQPQHLSHTLQHCIDYGMELVFVTREQYKDKNAIQQQYKNEDFYWIDEGGHGTKGMLGAADILLTKKNATYNQIFCACGTGTMIAGLIYGSLTHQTVTGISVLKGNTHLENDIRALLPASSQNKSFNLLHDYHFGGYAKHPTELIEWMKTLWQHELLPTDIVYTSKLLFAVKHLCNKGYFKVDDKILVIHSGGLQGNLSLPLGILPF